jgi:hypothetical protein
VTEHLPSQCEALSSSPGTARKEGREEKREGGQRGGREREKTLHTFYFMCFYSNVSHRNCGYELLNCEFAHT